MFLEVEDLFSTRNDTGSPRMFHAASEALSMGASIGVINDPFCRGTIGAHIIILSHGSEKHNFAVTHCHAVSPKKPLLVSPSDFDHRFWTDLFCKDLKAAEVVGLVCFLQVVAEPGFSLSGDAFVLSARGIMD